MGYQSPLHIIHHFQNDLKQISGDEIIRLRKKLLAEFNLTGETTITINGKEFTKDDVINQIDALKNIIGFDTHLQIYADKEVMRFCENPKKSKNPFTLIKVNFEKPETTEKYKSIVMEAEMISLKYHLMSDDYNKVHFIQQFFIQINYERAEESYDIINEQLLGLCDFLNSIHTENYHDHADRMKKFLNNAYFYRFINELPKELEQLKTAVIIELINLTTRIYHLNQHFTTQISWNLINLDCEKKHMDLIKSNHQVYTGEDATGNKTDGSMSESTVFRIILLIIYIIYQLSRI